MISASSLFLNPLVLWHKQFFRKIRNFVLPPCPWQCLLYSVSSLHLKRKNLHHSRALSGSNAWVPTAEQGPPEGSSCSLPPGTIPQGWFTVPRGKFRCSPFPIEHFREHLLILCVCPGFLCVVWWPPDGHSFITCSSQAGLNYPVKSFHLPTKGQTKILKIFVQPSYKEDVSISGGICFCLNLNSCRVMRS